MNVYCDLKYPNVFSTYEHIKRVCLHLHTALLKANDKDLKGSHAIYLSGVPC